MQWQPWCQSEGKVVRGGRQAIGRGRAAKVHGFLASLQPHPGLSQASPLPSPSLTPHPCAPLSLPLLSLTPCSLGPQRPLQPLPFLSAPRPKPHPFLSAPRPKPHPFLSGTWPTAYRRPLHRARPLGRTRASHRARHVAYPNTTCSTRPSQGLDCRWASPCSPGLGRQGSDSCGDSRGAGDGGAGALCRRGGPGSSSRRGSVGLHYDVSCLGPAMDDCVTELVGLGRST